MRKAMRRMLCALGLGRFCDVPERARPDAERVRERQREVAARAARLGVQVDVVARGQTGKEGR